LPVVAVAAAETVIGLLAVVGRVVISQVFWVSFPVVQQTGRSRFPTMLGFIGLLLVLVVLAAPVVEVAMLALTATRHSSALLVPWGAVLAGSVLTLVLLLVVGLVALVVEVVLVVELRLGARLTSSKVSLVVMRTILRQQVTLGPVVVLVLWALTSQLALVVPAVLESQVP
jgi:hypothetical protein